MMMHGLAKVKYVGRRY